MTDVNDITIEEANNNADPVIDATGATNGAELNANGITIKGLIVQNAVSNGFFLFDRDGNTLIGNTASNNGAEGFALFDSSAG